MLNSESLIHIDSYNVLNNSYSMNQKKLIESLISYDQVVLQMGNPKKTIKSLLDILSLDIFEEYIRNNVISFCKTDINYSISTGGFGDFIIPDPFSNKSNTDNESLENSGLSLKEYYEVQISDALKNISIDQKRKRNLEQIILDNLNIVPPDRINRELCLKTILSEIRDVNLVNKIRAKNNLFFGIDRMFDNNTYSVELLRDGFHITINEKDKIERNKIHATLTIAFMILMYTNVFMNTSNIIKSTGVWVDSSTSDIIENKYLRFLTHQDKNNESFKLLMKKERVPDIGELFCREKITIADIDKIRAKSVDLRSLISKFDPSDEIEIYNEYLNFVQNNSCANDMIPMKFLRFFLVFSVGGSLLGSSVGSILNSSIGGFVGGLLPSAIDSFLLPSVGSNHLNYVRFQDILIDLKND